MKSGPYERLGTERHCGRVSGWWWDSEEQVQLIKTLSSTTRSSLARGQRLPLSVLRKPTKKQLKEMVWIHSDYARVGKISFNLMHYSECNVDALCGYRIYSKWPINKVGFDVITLFSSFLAEVTTVGIGKITLTRKFFKHCFSLVMFVKQEKVYLRLVSRIAFSLAKSRPRCHMTER